MELNELELKHTRENTTRLNKAEVSDLLAELDQNWKIVLDKILQKEYKFKDFKESRAFLNRIGDLADEVNHHPDLLLKFNSVRVELWTHDVGGLTRNDFILAAKIEELV